MTWVVLMIELFVVAVWCAVVSRCGACADLLFNVIVLASEFVHQGQLPGVGNNATWQSYSADVISIPGSVSYGVRDQCRQLQHSFFTNILKVIEDSSLEVDSLLYNVHLDLLQPAGEWYGELLHEDLALV
ncbi:hypothetical protein DAPPUDRAFT_255921 [Daphnia pulex]|uniref:Uncharacterized protein n=1 Tax=Daphnia pulex TaxID=6669 RepID=E9HAC7_DAPPU|nr:hypothetical protein DAPPUDRAFT_255921 [Daphnia pulex]|eukprot:EFX71284.1 hypothetical protein DAPPUDRAFT_255921 [Daphnia pulex]